MSSSSGLRVDNVERALLGVRGSPDRPFGNADWPDRFVAISPSWSDTLNLDAGGPPLSHSRAHTKALGISPNHPPAAPPPTRNQRALLANTRAPARFPRSFHPNPLQGPTSPRFIACCLRNHQRLEAMTRLQLSLAIGDYDRTRPLLDGGVQIDGVAPIIMALGPEEIFFRAFRHAEFDICELSLSSFTVLTAAGECPYVGVPAFVSRAFRHTSIYVRKDRIKSPCDLKNRKIGIAEYQLTANVWARALLAEDYGLLPHDPIWVRGGLEEPGRPEKIALA